MQKITNTWTYKHIQLIVIIGLVTGISIESLGGGAGFLTETQAIEYTREDVPHISTDCDQKCMLNQWAHKRALELHAENRAMDLEKYRMQALEEGKNLLLSILDESEFIDYGAMYDKYGY